jgi:endonuclease/exonuclease/phosphatase family metal-dependent hydrolase
MLHGTKKYSTFDAYLQMKRYLHIPILLLMAATLVPVVNGATLKVATFNAEWLGCPSQAPDNDTLQIRNVAAVIRLLNVDIIGLQEVTDNPRKSLDELLADLNKNANIYAGHVEVFSTSSCIQCEAIVYKKNRVVLNGTPRLMNDAGTSNAWASGRYPVECRLTVDGNTDITLINLHAKAMSDATSYARRVEASKGLKALLDGSGYSSRNIIVLGDFNDNLSGSTCRSCGVSPYKNFVDDNTHYQFLTSSIDAERSQIDHIMISDELFDRYVSGSTTRETSVTSSISSYSSTTSDHIPVSAIFDFGKRSPALPLPNIYTKLLVESSFALPLSVTLSGQKISYALDSGSAVSLAGNTVSLLRLGKVRVRAWVSESSSFGAAEMSFHILVVDKEQQPQIVVHPADQQLNDEPGQGTAVFLVQATGTQLRYLWFKDGSAMAGDTTLQLTVRNANNKDIASYACRVSNSAGSELSNVAKLCIQGMCPLATKVVQLGNAGSLRVYPNPAFSGVLNVECEAMRSGDRVEIYSLAGALVKACIARGTSLSVDISSLPQGMYVVRVGRRMQMIIKN